MAYIGSQPANKPVVASDLDPAVITGQTALGATPADTDEFIISDAGVLKRMDYSYIKGGGQKTLLHTVTASDTSSVVFNNTYITSTYRDYHITFSNIHSANDNVGFNLHFSTDNGSSYVSSNVNMSTFGMISSSTSVQKNVSTNSSGGKIELTCNQSHGNATGESTSGEITLYDFLGTDNHKSSQGVLTGENYGGEGMIIIIGGQIRATTAINAVKFSFASGTISSGVFKIYGIT